MLPLPRAMLLSLPVIAAHPDDIEIVVSGTLLRADAS